MFVCLVAISFVLYCVVSINVAVVVFDYDESSQRARKERKITQLNDYNSALIFMLMHAHMYVCVCFSL